MESKFPIYYKYSIAYSDACDTIVCVCLKEDRVIEIEFTENMGDVSKANHSSGFFIYWYTPTKNDLKKLLRKLYDDDYQIITESEFYAFYYKNTEIIETI